MVKRTGLCGICPAGCWVEVELRDGKITQVAPQSDHPLGMICTIGRHSPNVIYDPDRLQHPLRRTGAKGTHEFERISWDQAYEIITERLQSIKAEHGPEATAIYTGRGSFDMAMCDLLQPEDAAVSSASSILFPFGSPNTLGVGALCYVSFAIIAPHSTLGEMLITMDTDIEQAELVVLWGANPATDSPPVAHGQVTRAHSRGADIVAIDPRRNGTARQTDAEWVPIRPGTDGALALSMIQVLIEEELYDEQFVANWTVGFDELATLTQHYRPEVAAGITRVPADTIRQLARRIASARGACPIMYSGLEYSDSGVQAIRAVLILWALAGQLDVPGGLLIRMKDNVFPQNRNHLLANPNPRRALGRDRFPIYTAYRGESHAIALPDSVLRSDPYKIRALTILGGSLITSWPNPSLWRETLGALDFLVCIDRYHTADSAYADIVLPATTAYEITSYMRYGPLFKLRERMIEPIGEARSDFMILAELADRLGYGELFPQTEEQVLERALEGSGFTVQQVRAAGGHVQLPGAMLQYKKWEKGLLRPDKEVGFDTPSGKFEISSSLLAEHGYEPLPVYTEPKEGPLARPDLADKYPLVLTTGTRTLYDFRSQHHGVAGLRDRSPEPNVIMHPEDAATRTITDGDPVWVQTQRGRVQYRARVTPDIAPGVVDAQMGGGGPLGPQQWQQCNVNELTDLNHFDPISGFPIYKTLLCDILRADGDARGQQQDTEEPAPRPAAPTGPARQVYLDNNATTRVLPEVRTAMLPHLQEQFANPSSVHSPGGASRAELDRARRKVAALLNCTARRVIFTGSGTEANNLAIQGALAATDSKKTHLITSAVEHPAVLATCRAMAEQGYELTVLPVDSSGRIAPADLRSALRDDTALVSIMLANNEVGTTQPIPELAALARQRGALFHTDAVQGAGKLSVDVEQLGVDLLSISGHKLGGPKGIGALYLRKGVALRPLMHGGGQEHGLRSGTENVAGAVGLGVACELAIRRLLAGYAEQTTALRDRLEQGLVALVPEALANGAGSHRVPNTLNLTLPEIRGESLVLFLDRRGVYFSAGSACKSGNPAPSHALLAMGLTEEQAHCAVRFSLGFDTTVDEIDYALAQLQQVLADTASAIRFVGCR